MTDAEIPDIAAAPWGDADVVAPTHPKLDDLIAILARLRAPGGCVWDREQTHESLVRYLIEETHELVDAIETGTRAELIEELGDVLYQVVFHSDIAAHAEDPADRFDIEHVAEHMTKKMISRHPHVFAQRTAATADDVVAIWDDVKSVEKAHRTSVLDGIALGMPSLLLADKLLSRAHKVGVDPTTIGGRAAEHGEPGADADEQRLGSELLALVASARLHGLDAERALRTALRGLSDDIRSVEAQTRLGSNGTGPTGPGTGGDNAKR